MPIHIKGIDVVTRKTKILKAIENKIGTLKEEEYRMSDFRPMHGGKYSRDNIGKRNDDELMIPKER